MTEYTKFIERRKRVEAFQFLNAEQALAVANAFNSNDFELWTNGSKCQLDVTVQNGDGSTYKQRVNRGDYIVRDDWWDRSLPRVVSPQEFRDMWEKDG